MAENTRSQLYATSILILERMQANLDLLEKAPREFGALHRAVAQSTTAATQAMTLIVDIRDRLTKTIDNVVIDEGQAISFAS